MSRETGYLIAGALVLLAIWWMMRSARRKREGMPLDAFDPKPAGIPKADKARPASGRRKRREWTEAEMADLEQRLRSLAAPALRLESEDPDEPLDEASAPVATRIGGRPAMPPGAAWPRTTAGAPMTFLAQVDLRDVHTHLKSAPLPAAGMLSFFVRCVPKVELRPDGAMEAAVVFSASAPMLQLMEFPSDLDPAGRLAARPVTCREQLTYPFDHRADVLERLIPEERDNMPYRFWFDRNEGTYLLGYAASGGMAAEEKAEMVARRAHGEDVNADDFVAEDSVYHDHRLLARFAFVEGWGPEQYLSEEIHFMLHRSDLSAGRLERAIAVYSEDDS